MNLNELSTILEIGWPNHEDMMKIPFGEQMEFLGNSEDHGKHVKKLLKA